MFWKMKFAESEPVEDSRVSAIDAAGQPPPTDMELWVLSILPVKGSLPLNDIVGRVAERLYRDALRHGAASVDIGLFGVMLFTPEAMALMSCGNGRWWAIAQGTQILANEAVQPGAAFACKSGPES